jgi:hypothetical protein
VNEEVMPINMGVRIEDENVELLGGDKVETNTEADLRVNEESFRN